VQKLAVQAAITVDPQSATRRREDAERNKCRVQVFREETGAAGLSGRDLPTDQTLAAHAHVCARAQDYQASGAFPGDTRMDQYRAAAYLDLLNGIPADARIATGQLDTVNRDTDEPDAGEPNDDGGPNGGDPPGGRTRAQAKVQAAARTLPVRPTPRGAGLSLLRLADLVLPLTTLLGLADRPGEGHGLGPLDPDLCRELAMAATGSHSPGFA
jgi:hypothetical protein